MRRLNKISIALIMVLCLLFSLIGCGETNEIVGKWETKIAHDDLSGDVVSIKTDLDEFIDMSNVYKTITYEFKADGTYIEKADVDSYIEDYNAAMKNALDLFYTDLIARNNLDMTIAEAMAIDEITYDDYYADQDSVEEQKEAEESKGKYKTKEGNLYLSAGLNYDVDESVYTVYSIEGDKLTFEKQFGGKMSLTEGFFNYPLVFTKVD